MCCRFFFFALKKKRPDCLHHSLLNGSNEDKVPNKVNKMNRKFFQWNWSRYNLIWFWLRSFSYMLCNSTIHIVIFVSVVSILLWSTCVLIECCEFNERQVLNSQRFRFNAFSFRFRFILFIDCFVCCQLVYRFDEPNEWTRLANNIF